jgi:hypothetical protein
MRRSCFLAAWICAALLLPLGGEARADDEQGTLEPNIRIILSTGKVGDDADAAEKTYRLVTRADGPPARLLMGWRMPIPTTRSVGEGEDDEQEVSFVYQNVGMSAHLETRLLGPDHVLVRGMIEISAKRNGPTIDPDAGRPPVIGTFQQDLSVALRDGETLRVAEIPDPEGGTLFLDLRAEVIR